MNTACENTIEQLFLKPFGSLNFSKRESIIEIGRRTLKLPYLTIKSKNYVRTIKHEYYT